MLTLANLITRMNIYTPVFTIDEARKVNALDQAVRALRSLISPPWTLKKTTLRVFFDILEYPKASDHARLAFIDTQKGDEYADRARYVFTSIKDFLEDPTYRNEMAEIWKSGTKFLGVRYKDSSSMTSTTLNEAEDLTGWTSSGDAGTLVLDQVVFKKGNGAIRVPIVNSSGTATVSTSITSTSDTDYLRKYHFRWVFLGGAVTSLSLRLGKTSSDYFSSTVTTQFSGAPFIANDWNLVAFDLNTASSTGSPDSTFAYQAIIFTGAATGTYYLDESYLKGWDLQDYWYYSSNNVYDTSAAANADYFALDGATYDVSDSLLGDDVWFEMITADACEILLADAKESSIRTTVLERKMAAYAAFFAEYPDLEPRMTTTVYRFQDDYQKEFSFDRTIW